MIDLYLIKKKSIFVDSLCDFYKMLICSTEFETMWYNAEANTEFVYVKYRGGGVKRFCVAGDSNRGILFDFIRFLEFPDDYPWLMGKYKRPIL